MEVDLAEEGGRFFQSIFKHRIIWIGDINIDELDDGIIPLSTDQTNKFISDYSLLTIEARSLWSLMEYKDNE